MIIAPTSKEIQTIKLTGYIKWQQQQLCSDKRTINKYTGSNTITNLILCDRYQVNVHEVKNLKSDKINLWKKIKDTSGTMFTFGQNNQPNRMSDNNTVPLIYTLSIYNYIVLVLKMYHWNISAAVLLFENFKSSFPHFISGTPWYLIITHSQSDCTVMVMWPNGLAPIEVPLPIC